ncbi:MAG: ROK family protein [Cyclobacteriaceae bacterium]
MTQLAIGVDIGGTNSKFGITDREGNIIVQSRINTQGYLDFSGFIQELKIQVGRIHSMSQVIGIGVGAPNANFYKGTIEYPPNLPWVGISDFAAEVERVFEKKCVVTNDANAAALGEMTFGKAKEMKDFLVITLGTGLGAGIVANGELVYGNHGLAGELGHTLAIADGRKCGCGKAGCLETYVSATGIRATVYELLADKKRESTLRSVSFGELTSKKIAQAAMKGDKVALEAFDYTGRVLGLKLADFVVHTDPEAIFLLGGLARAGAHIFNPTQEHLDLNLMPLFLNKKIQLQSSGLKDDDAAILGASSLVWKYIESDINLESSQ